MAGAGLFGIGMSLGPILPTGWMKYRTMSSEQVEVAEMKNRLLFISLVVAVMVAIVTMVNLWMTSPRTMAEAHSHPAYPAPLYKVAKRITLKELIDVANAHGIDLYLPTKMPDNISLEAIYYKPPVIMLSYCDREVTDYRYDNVTIQISMWLHTPPSLEDLKKIAEKDPDNLKVLDVNGAMGILIEKARWGNPELQEMYGSSPYAYFWLGDHYNTISATPPITSDQLIEIKRSMKPLRG